MSAPTNTTSAPLNGETASPNVSPAGTPEDTFKAPLRRAETQDQALHLDRNASDYRRAGYCDPCSAQAAWGHQCGFSLVRPPCDACRGLPLPDRHDHPRAQRWSQQTNDSSSHDRATRP